MEAGKSFDKEIQIYVGNKKNFNKMEIFHCSTDGDAI